MTYVRYGKGTRLGNWLFQYAAARSVDDRVAWYVPCPVREGLFDDLLKLIPDLTIVTRVPEGSFKVQDGYCQDASLFDERLVRKLYKCPPDVESRLRAAYPAVFGSRETVGIHVRRGDYLALPHRFPFVGTTYLKRAVGRFPRNFLFVVCSDDVPWCRRFFTGRNFPGREFLFVEGESVWDDLFAQSFCRHNIISNSTFSWWGAWLNGNPGKRVVFPSRWFGPDVKESAAGLYPPTAEIVPCAFRPSIYPFWAFYAVKRCLGDIFRSQ